MVYLHKTDQFERSLMPLKWFLWV
ncbi:rCG40545, isoform CRA_a [Rattus norvegicus]|uniref:RCG40545, isoform CRA_a n=1 Tax=Rattus norvegicus TaxID=10116 RepID=A6I838_RAT|nr:rCG40545, isoform CRA_a [Rattus norvegicus]